MPATLKAYRREFWKTIKMGGDVLPGGEQADIVILDDTMNVDDIVVTSSSSSDNDPDFVPGD